MFVKKTALLAATLLAGVSTSVYAQANLPAPGPNDGDASLHGAGASAVQNFVVRTANCVGVDNQLGISSGAAGSFRTISQGNFAGAPAFNCATQVIQADFSLKYVSTGSGFGRRAWYMYKDNFSGSPTNGATNVHNPFNTLSGQSRWSHVQFAFSEAPISPTELTRYTTGGTDSVFGTYAGASTSAGAAIQIPLYILPVAVAYNPVYGKNASGVDMVFNATSSTAINGVSSAAIKMSRQVYCRVFNGEVTNWNNSLFASLNGSKTLQDLTNDTAARWSTDGVPIRLVGRMDPSGTTDIFTRHLAAVCGTSGTLTGTNKYLKNADNLPYNGSSTVDFSVIREDSNYKPTGTVANNAGTTNMISASYWDDVAKEVKILASGPSGEPTGNVGSGLFIMGNGNGHVANAIKDAPDYALNGVMLNGKVGYVSADFVTPSPEAAGVSYSQLQIGTSTKYAAPSTANALKSFGSGATALLPPQSATNGDFLSTDTRQVRNAAGTLVNATRDNPIAWTDVLYIPTAGNTLAAPLAGYPMVGTSQFLGYTCYTPSNRSAIVEFLGLTTAGISKNETNGSIAKTLFTSTSSTTPGILTQSNVGSLPASWLKATQETFLKNSTQTSNGTRLGNLNLWIQSKFVLSSSKSPGDLTSNPTCASLPGA